MRASSPLHHATLRNLFGAIAIQALASVASATTVLYVSSNGNDAWSGALSAPNAALTDGPKATLGGAWKVISNTQVKNPMRHDSYVVNVAPGTYTSLSGLVVTNADPLSSVTFRSTVAGAAIIDGSVEVSEWTVPPAGLASRLSPKAKPYVVAVDLKKAGLTNFGTLPKSHWTGNSSNLASSYNELFMNNVRQTIARWPNGGYATVRKDGTTSSFQTNLSTSRALATDTDINVYSFVSGYDWAFQGMPVTVDRATDTITTSTAMTYPAKAAARFFLRNSLEELDTPGEYYVDRSTGYLLWYPKPGYQTSSMRVSGNTGPLVTMSNSYNTTFDGFTVRNSRGDGISIIGGSGNGITRSTLTNVGGYAVRLMNTSNASVDSCSMTEMGEGGVRMDGGGDMVTLSAGNNVVQNCTIRGLGRLVPSYRPGILIAGVGNSALNNDISDGPHCAIQIQGAKQTVEGNHISEVCKDTADAGAVYTSGVPTWRGNVIRGNFIENVKNKINTGGIWGIYLDSRSSGLTIDHNVIKNTDIGMIVNGGRDNRIVNNVTVDCPLSFQLDDRSHETYAGLDAALAAVPYKTGIWASTFPQLVNILNDDPTYAKNNVFARNGMLRTGKALNLRSLTMTTISSESNLGLTQLGWNIMVAADSGLFVDEAKGNYTPLPGTTLANAGFTPVLAGQAAQSAPVSAVRLKNLP
jgi:hypothetical protein